MSIKDFYFSTVNDKVYKPPTNASIPCFNVWSEYISDAYVETMN